jgi:hypothetical protein
MKMKTLLPVVAVLFGLFTPAQPAFAQDWTLTSAPVTNWTSIASSADGTRLVALASANGGAPIYASSDSGTTWASLANAPNELWSCIASSADGSKLVAGTFTSRVYVSINFGTTWAQTSAPSNYWVSVGSSADGTELMAACVGGTGIGGFYTSGDSGTTWSNTLTWGSLGWASFACSADGTKWVGAWTPINPNNVDFGSIFVSTNSGYTWRTSGAPKGPIWGSVASSADGTKLAAAVGDPHGSAANGPIYTSTNSGATWRPSIMPNLECWCIGSSADGTKLVAFGGLVYLSTNSGAAWWSHPNQYFSARFGCSSADGKAIAALVTSVNGGPIYTLQTTPTPILNLIPCASNALLSWLIPSMDFTLQQNSDLTTTNWTDVPTPPVLNLTNLQNQVLVSPTNGNTFYRLKH